MQAEGITGFKLKCNIAGGIFRTVFFIAVLYRLKKYLHSSGIF
jgi:hypothetical protein